jgi:hypothetical protein
VRVLLDEHLPHDSAKLLTGPAVSTVQGLGWAGTKNGALLTRAEASSPSSSRCALSFGIVIIGAASNRIADLLPVLPELLQIIDIVQPGEARRVGTSPKE